VNCDNNAKHGQGCFYPSDMPWPYRPVVCLCLACRRRQLAEIEARRTAQMKAWGLL
jgi:hypothetical protein